MLPPRSSRKRYAVVLVLRGAARSVRCIRVAVLFRLPVSQNALATSRFCFGARANRILISLSSTASTSPTSQSRSRSTVFRGGCSCVHFSGALSLWFSLWLFLSLSLSSRTLPVSQAGPNAGFARCVVPVFRRVRVFARVCGRAERVGASACSDGNVRRVLCSTLSRWTGTCRARRGVISTAHGRAPTPGAAGVMQCSRAVARGSARSTACCAVARPHNDNKRGGASACARPKQGLRARPSRSPARTRATARRGCGRRGCAPTDESSRAMVPLGSARGASRCGCGPASRSRARAVRGRSNARTRAQAGLVGARP